MTPEKYLDLAGLAYSKTPKVDFKELEGFEDWKFITALDNPVTGYKGITLKSPEGNLFFAHAGTDGSEIKEFIKDLSNDIDLALEQVPDQFADAERMIQLVTERYPGTETYHVGHSLGGALAQLSAHKYGHDAVAFEPPGMKEILAKVPPINGEVNHDQFESYVIRGSMISGANTQVGDVSIMDVVPPDDLPSKLKAWEYAGKFHSRDSIKGCFENGKLVKSIDENPDYLDQVLQEKWAANPVISYGREHVMTMHGKYETYENYKEDYIKRFDLEPATPAPAEQLYTPMENTENPLADILNFDDILDYDEVDGVSMDDLEDAAEQVEEVEDNMSILFDQLASFQNSVTNI